MKFPSSAARRGSLLSGLSGLLSCALLLGVLLAQALLTPTVQAASAGGSCYATLEPASAFTPGQPLILKASVENAQGAAVTPSAEKWLFNSVEAANGTFIWDGKAVTVEYHFTCPLDNQAQVVYYSIPARPGQGIDWLALAGWLGALAGLLVLAGLAAGAFILLRSRSNRPAPLTENYAPPPASDPVRPSPAAGAAPPAEKPASPPASASAPAQAGAPYYALQVSATSLELKSGQYAPLSIQAWRVMPNGARLPAPEAAISVQVPPGGLAVNPASGRGALNCLFYAAQAPACASFEVTVGAAAQAGRASAQVTVTVLPSYSLQFAWQEGHPALQPGAEGAWAWARLQADPPGSAENIETLTAQITFSVQGANPDWVSLAPGEVRDGCRWVQAACSPPALGAALKPGVTLVKAQVIVGSETLQADLEAPLCEEPLFSALVNGQAAADVRFLRRWGDSGWEFADIITCYTAPSEPTKTVAPVEKFFFNAPPIQADPPVLEVREMYEIRPATIGLKVGLAQGVDLEQYFGPHLADHDGLIHVTVSVRSSSGKTMQASLVYRLRPQLELFAHDCDSSGRTYQGLELEAEEFITDGDDQACLLIGCCRTDLDGPRHAGLVRQLEPGWWTFVPSLRGEAVRDFQVRLPDEPDETGQRLLAVRSRRPLLYQTSREGDRLTLRLEGRALDNLPSNYLNEPFLFELPLKPRYPDLRLWVMPGRQRGASTAWMAVFLDQEAFRPLPEMSLKVRTGVSIKPGENPAALVSVPALKCASGQDEARLLTQADGSGQVDLLYTGLEWSSFRAVVLHVECCLTSRDGDVQSDPLRIDIDLQENVESLLKALYAERASLRLTNPFWQERALSAHLQALTAHRPFTRGPLWRALGRLAGEPGQFGDEYNDRQLCERISSWLAGRRRYQPGSPDSLEAAAAMNGIEFDQFTAGRAAGQDEDLHQYAAIFLSGMAPAADPRGLDPWWTQEWENPAYLQPEGLLDSLCQANHYLALRAWFSAAQASLSAALRCLPGLETNSAAKAAQVIGAQAAGCAASAAVELSASPLHTAGFSVESTLPYVGLADFLKDWAALHPHG